MEYTFSCADKCGNARQGAKDLFDFVKEQIREEIYLLYLDKCQKEFFNEYRFEDGEPFVKGMMEARYYMLRMFHISFCEYFKSLDDYDSSACNDEKTTGKHHKIPA